MKFPRITPEMKIEEKLKKEPERFGFEEVVEVSGEADVRMGSTPPKIHERGRLGNLE